MSLNMKIYNSLTELQSDVSRSIKYTDKQIIVTSKQILQNTIIDNLVYSSALSPDEDIKKESRKLIYELAVSLGCFSQSIHNLYMAAGKGEITGFTVPAINIRTLTYDSAQLIFSLATKHKIGAVTLEIARSEMKYTEQQPDEYTTSILAAAIKTGYQGPIFIQGDHYQFSAKTFKADRDEEINNIKALIKKSIDAKFYNIDIDASTLVDLEKPTFSEQQKENYEMTALLTKYIRSIQPAGIEVSIGGEIGHIGGKNSTTEDFEAYIKGYLPLVENLAGISKVSVQTGTSHGGTVLPDGSIAQVNLDFDVLRNISGICRKKYHIGGSVQHGASTLPNELFNRFPESNTLEIHLATGFQNIVYDHLPQELKLKMYDWLMKNCLNERKENSNDEQFIYELRKKALGPFKKQLWLLSDQEKAPILENLEKQFAFLFEKLNMFNTRSTVEKYIKT